MSLALLALLFLRIVFLFAFFLLRGLALGSLRLILPATSSASAFLGCLCYDMHNVVQSRLQACKLHEVSITSRAPHLHRILHRHHRSLSCFSCLARHSHLSSSCSSWRCLFSRLFWQVSSLLLSRPLLPLLHPPPGPAPRPTPDPHRHCLSESFTSNLSSFRRAAGSALGPALRRASTWLAAACIVCRSLS